MCDSGRPGLHPEATDATVPTDDWERLSEFTRFRGSRASSLAWLERPADNRKVASPNLAGPTSGRALHRGRGRARPEVGPARFGLATFRLSAGRSNQAKLLAREPRNLVNSLKRSQSSVGTVASVASG